MALVVHPMDELPKYKEISDKFLEEAGKIDEYKIECAEKALDMLKEHFYSLWD